MIKRATVGTDKQDGIGSMGGDEKEKSTERKRGKGGQEEMLE